MANQEPPKRYLLIGYTDPSQLINDINHYIEIGFVPQGGVSVVMLRDGTLQFIQAMVRLPPLPPINI